MKTENFSTVLTTPEAAEFLGLRPGTLEVWRCHNLGPRYVKVGSRVVYRASDLQNFMDSKMIETRDSQDNKNS